MQRAVFLDRDGVLNPLVYNLATGEYESPHDPGEFSIYPRTARSLQRLVAAGFLLFLVSNQPSYAKGKTSLENIQAIQELLAEYLQENLVNFTDFFYCVHHPAGIVPGFSGPCQCRKPSPFFLKRAAAEHSLDLHQCWLIGDQDTDVLCGQAAGVRTIQILNPHSSAKRGGSIPDHQVDNLAEAVDVLLRSSVGE
jgi:D-glycero-D-manno-heptose 1,7-bisphosphate phosphatase